MWYTFDLCRGGKKPDQVRPEVQRKVRDVLAELRTKPVLNEFAGNPLLLTMIAIRYRLPTPEESRLYNYATVDCTAEPQRAQRYVKPSALSRPPSVVSFRRHGHPSVIPRSVCRPSGIAYSCIRGSIRGRLLSAFSFQFLVGSFQLSAFSRQRSVVCPWTLCNSLV